MLAEKEGPVGAFGVYLRWRRADWVFVAMKMFPLEYSRTCCGPNLVYGGLSFSVEGHTNKWILADTFLTWIFTMRKKKKVIEFHSN